MLPKLIPIIVIVVLVWLLFFNHGGIPGFGRRTGRKVRDLRQAGAELLDGEEVEGSPLARYEFQAGRAVTARILTEHPLAGEADMQKRVLRIGRRLAEGSARNEIRYRFAVLEDSEPNAMAIPGGSIFVTRGLVELCDDDDVLAGILSHEIAHIDLRHAARTLATRAVAKTGLRLLTFGRGAIVGQLAGRVEGLVTRGYSRDREIEADRAAIQLADRAGFSRNGLPRLFARLVNSAAEGSAYFQSHPPLAERLHELKPG